MFHHFPRRICIRRCFWASIDWGVPWRTVSREPRDNPKIILTQIKENPSFFSVVSSGKFFRVSLEDLWRIPIPSYGCNPPGSWVPFLSWFPFGKHNGSGPVSGFCTILAICCYFYFSYIGSLFAFNFFFISYHSTAKFKCRNSLKQVVLNNNRFIFVFFLRFWKKNQLHKSI